MPDCQLARSIREETWSTSTILVKPKRSVDCQYGVLEYYEFLGSLATARCVHYCVDVLPRLPGIISRSEFNMIVGTET